MSTTPSTMRFASASSTNHNIQEAIDELVAKIHDEMGDTPIDLMWLFISSFFTPSTIQISLQLQTMLHAKHTIGGSAEGIIGADREIEGMPAMAIVAAHLPDVDIHPFTLNGLALSEKVQDSADFKAQIGVEDADVFIMLADPFTTPIEDIISAFNRDYEGVPLVGGMASASNRIGGNALLIDDDFFNVGAVGLALSGAIDVDVIVSQGCRPIGRMMTVTDSQDNAIFSLDGQAPAPLIRELYETMNPSEQKLFQESGIFIGRAMQSIGIAQNGDGSAQPVAYPDELGRGDFLVRAVMGVERETGALVVADQFKVGERVQFQLRDANTAEEDLDMLLVPQSFREAPAGALLFSCNGRGTRLYPHENGDIRIINETFGDIPLAGFFANGELGPVAQNNFLHGHTASLVLFRPKTVD